MALVSRPDTQSRSVFATLGVNLARLIRPGKKKPSANLQKLAFVWIVANDTLVLIEIRRDHERVIENVAPIQTVGERLLELQIEGVRRGRVTRFCVLSQQRPFWPDEKEFTDLRSEIQSWYAAFPANESTVAPGNDCEVLVGQKKVVKVWKSLTAVQKAVGGVKAFRAICVVTFKAVSGITGNTAATAMQTEAQTGYRKLTAVAHVAPAVELPKAA